MALPRRAPPTTSMPRDVVRVNSSMLSRVPDQSLVADVLEGADHIVATRGDGYAFVYSPMGRKFSITLGKVSGDKLKAWWFNPRTGTATELETLANRGSRDFTPPTEGFSGDWILVLDDESRKFPAPGSIRAP